MRRWRFIRCSVPVVVKANYPTLLTKTLEHLHNVAHLISHVWLCFNRDKTEMYHWSQHYTPSTLAW